MEELSKLQPPEDIVAEALGHEKGLDGGDALLGALTNKKLDTMQDNLSVSLQHTNCFLSVGLTVHLDVCVVASDMHHCPMYVMHVS